MSIDYFPEEMSMWDSWGIEHNRIAHIIYLQFYGKDLTRNLTDADWLGHATSPDLLRWTEKPLAFGPGPAGGPDDMQPWTGCVVKNDGKFYLFYTMRSTIDHGGGQKIGLALSDDLEHWERFPGNPVIVPDNRYYVSYEHPLLKHIVDCRDMVVIPDPEGSGWLGYFATRVHEGTASQTSAIGLARSKDLIHWEQFPPVFVPGNISAIEVPDVYQVDGKWYLTCLTGNRYGNRGYFSDQTILGGTIYAVADCPEGPYQMIPGDNVLIGGQSNIGYTCRTMEFGGIRYAFYTQPVVEGPATLSPPMELRTISGGCLRLAFSERAKGLRKKTLISPGDRTEIVKLPYNMSHWALHGGSWSLLENVYHGEAETGWQTADLGIGAENVEFSADISLTRGSAVGFVFRPDSTVDHSGSDHKGDFIFYLDADRQWIVSARLPAFDQQNVREFPFENGRTYRMRLCIRQPRFEIYVDDILVLQGALHWVPALSPSVGLFIDRGSAEVRGLELYELG